LRFRAVADGAFRQRHDSIKTAVSAFAAVVPFAIFLVFFATFALKRDRIVGHVDFDVVLRQTWQISANDKFIAALKRFYLWRPEAAALASAPERPSIARCKTECFPECRKRIAPAENSGEWIVIFV
jgi:hypothetical protein